MKAKDIVIGQTYRIRQWEDMVAEFGLDEEGEITCRSEKIVEDIPPCFNLGMRDLCGEEYTPTEIDPDKTGETDLFPRMGMWVIWPFMLEKC